MIRARAGRAAGRPARLLLLMTAGMTLLAACQTGPTSGPQGTPPPDASSTALGSPAGSENPTATANENPGPTEGVGASPTADVPTGSSGAPSASCSGDEKNRGFFRQAAAAMTWPVYCAVLPDGWFLESGSYRLADGGRLEVTYRGPADVHVEIVEGNACGGSDVNACAPRDAVIGPAAFADRTGELGRLANGLVLDVDRGATPSWRATGLGLTEEAFRVICTAFLAVEG